MVRSSISNIDQLPCRTPSLALLCGGRGTCSAIVSRRPPLDVGS